MPPKARQNNQNSEEQEGRLLLAISALKNQEIRNVREAARVYNVPCTTLRRRLSGQKSCTETRGSNYKLTKNEEESLVRWILSLDRRGAPPRQSHVQEMANILLAQRGTMPIQQVGEKWVYNFIERRDELKTQYTRGYDYRHLKCENPKTIKEWFNHV
jgi:hypothetical protein